jgi:SAM-dependent methyltransferase
MSISAPCYSRSSYWDFFRLDYAGLRVLDIGSSAGSFVRRGEFGDARNRLKGAALHVSLDIDAAARPGVVADAHALPFPSEAFDVVLANNVIEHLHDAATGVAEMRRVLRAGGSVLYTIPFLYPVHEAPNDFVRYTHYGLARLFDGFASAEINARGGWFSTVAQMLFMLTRAADPLRLGALLRAVLYPFLWLFVQLDRFDRSDAFTRVYYGRLRK